MHVESVGAVFVGVLLVLVVDLLSRKYEGLQQNKERCTVEIPDKVHFNGFLFFNVSPFVTYLRQFPS